MQGKGDEKKGKKEKKSERLKKDNSKKREFHIIDVRTSFNSNPKQEWAQVQKARTMNL